MCETGSSEVNLNKHCTVFHFNYFGMMYVATSVHHPNLHWHHLMDGRLLENGENCIIESQNMKKAMVIGDAT